MARDRESLANQDKCYQGTKGLKVTEQESKKAGKIGRGLVWGLEFKMSKMTTRSSVQMGAGIAELEER